MEEYIEGAEDINNSDIDFCNVKHPDGTNSVYIAYSWGNQQGTEFLGAAEVKNATVSSWLMSYFWELSGVLTEEDIMLYVVQEVIFNFLICK